MPFAKNTIFLLNLDTKLGKRTRTPYRYTVPIASTVQSTGRGWYSDDSGQMSDYGAFMRLRIEDANKHITGRTADIIGYYCDYDGDGDTLQPIIARLPRSKGFLAGWTMGAGMCGRIDATIWEDATDAAYEAHRMAESDAEKEREYQIEERQKLENAKVGELCPSCGEAALEQEENDVAGCPVCGESFDLE